MGEGPSEHKIGIEKKMRGRVGKYGTFTSRRSVGHSWRENSKR